MNVVKYCWMFIPINRGAEGTFDVWNIPKWDYDWVGWYSQIWIIVIVWYHQINEFSQLEEWNFNTQIQFCVTDTNVVVSSSITRRMDCTLNGYLCWMYKSQDCFIIQQIECWTGLWWLGWMIPLTFFCYACDKAKCLCRVFPLNIWAELNDALNLYLWQGKVFVQSFSFEWLGWTGWCS